MGLKNQIRLDELVILVYSFVKIGWKMAKLWPWEVRAKVALAYIGP